MLYLKINYFTHLLLNSKYRAFTNLFIILSFYSLLYENNIVFCMNDNPDIVETPIIAEAKESIRPCHQVIALKNEITDFAGNYATFVEENQNLKQRNERLANLVRNQQKEILNLSTRCSLLEKLLEKSGHEPKDVCDY